MEHTVVDRSTFFGLTPAAIVPRTCSKTEKGVPLQIENFGTLMTQVSFCELNYDGVRMDAVP
jgi:hypothetical protein